jgi:hypothetical protein
MNANHNENKKFLVNQLVRLGIFLGISLTISVLVPFPISLVAIIVVFSLLNLLYMRGRMVKRMGMGMRGEISDSTTSSSLMFGYTLKYYCMSCGTQHTQASCPKCGSKMKRVGS